MTRAFAEFLKFIQLGIAAWIEKLIKKLLKTRVLEYRELGPPVNHFDTLI